MKTHMETESCCIPRAERSPRWLKQNEQKDKRPKDVEDVEKIRPDHGEELKFCSKCIVKPLRSY